VANLSSSIYLVPQYFLFANTIKGASRFHVQNILVALKGMSNSITGEENRGSSKAFPFVTVPKFEILGESTRKQSGMEIVAFTPMVTEENVPAWLKYSIDNQGWMDDSREVVVSSGEGSLHVSDYLPGGIMPFIFDFDETSQIVPSKGPGPFLPLWQMSPPPFFPGFVNYNMKQSDAFLHTLFDAIEVVHEAVFTAVEDLSQLAGTGVKFEDHEAYHASLVNWVKDGVKDGSSSTYGHPHSVIMQPVFKNLNDHSSEIVGVITGVVPWDRYLIDLLPVGVKGITCVLKNTCEQSFTYALNGNEVRAERRQSLSCCVVTVNSNSFSPSACHCRRFTLEKVTSMKQNTATWKSSYLSPITPGPS
jgi:hypothetical protein